MARRAYVPWLTWGDVMGLQDAIGKLDLDALKTMGRKAARNLPSLLEPAGHLQQRCRVCRERISTLEVVTAFNRHFRCDACGHHTHVACSSSKEYVCRRCVEGPPDPSPKRKPPRRVR